MRKMPDTIRLSEVVALLGFEGFEIVNRRGSHDTYHADGRVLVVVRPHGGRNTLHPEDIRRILEALQR